MSIKKDISKQMSDLGNRLLADPDCISRLVERLVAEMETRINNYDNVSDIHAALTIRMIQECADIKENNGIYTPKKIKKTFKRSYFKDNFFYFLL